MKLVDTQAVAVLCGVAVATVRSWARRGHLTPMGRFQRRTLYDIRQAETLAAARRHAEDHANTINVRG